MNTNLIQQTIEGSINSTMIFPQIVVLLIEEGIESYHVDIIRNENRYYKPCGDSHTAKVELTHDQPAEDFSAEQVNAAVRKVQAGKSNYKSFMKEITEAGCVYYIAYLSGKKVIYFGRKGEMHVELFPQAK